MSRKKRHSLMLTIIILCCLWSAKLARAAIEEPLQDAVEQKLQISGPYPRVNESFEILYQVRLKPDADKDFEGNYCVQFEAFPFNHEPVVIEEIPLLSLKVGEWRDVRCRYHIPEAYLRINFVARLAREGCHFGLTGEGFKLKLLDSLTGQYGIPGQIKNTPENTPELFYDPAQDVTYPPDEYVDIYTQQRNREWLDEVEEIQAGLTKWEKLHLLHDVLYYPVRGTVMMTDLEAAQELLNAGWLEAYRAGQDARGKWLKDFYNKSKNNSNNENQGK
jgi:hypothetical protein